MTRSHRDKISTPLKRLGQENCRSGPYSHCTTSLFRNAASSLRVVSHEGDHAEVISLPFLSSVPTPPAAGNKRFASPSICDIGSGNKASKSTAIFAGIEITSSASPRLQARTICLAAFLALTLNSGRASLMLNHAYSNSCLPLKSALRGLPVRIKPGHTVVILMPSFINSTRKPFDSPTNANLLAL